VVRGIESGSHAGACDGVGFEEEGAGCEGCEGHDQDGVGIARVVEGTEVGE